MVTLTLGLLLLRSVLLPDSQRSLSSERRETLRLTIAGVVREAQVVWPSDATQTPSPVIFAFHGHGGNLRNAARKFALERAWPEAVVVYPQGLPTPGMTDSTGRQAGWQKQAGDQNDRDLQFFDQLLSEVRKRGSIDSHRIFAMGHSNGGAFTYLLWRTHPRLFAAIAPIAAGFGAGTVGEPIAVFHGAGKLDPLVPYRWQLRTVDRMRQLNRCVPLGHSWDPQCTVWDSPTGHPVVLFAYDGGHAYPAGASEKIVRFFRERSKP